MTKRSASIALTCSLLLGSLLSLAPSAWAAQALYSLARTGDKLRIIDPATGATLSETAITLPAATIFGGNGLARNPQTGEFYALVRTSSGFPSTRPLVKIEPLTGVATSIGDPGDKFAALTFDSNGTLWAVTGDGAATPESLYSLSLVDGNATFSALLGNGGDGEAIAFNPNDGLLYHASGVDGPPDTRILETIDPNSLAVNNVPISGHSYSEITVLAFSGSSFFAGATLPTQPDFMAVTDGGAFSLIGSMDHVSKGLAFGPAPIPTLGDRGRALLMTFVALTMIVILARRRIAT